MEKEKIKLFLKSKENLLFLLLIFFLVIIRLFYFFKLGNQPIWWDEADYLAISKIWATGSTAPAWLSHFTGMRPLLLPLLWTFFFKLNMGESFLRFFTILLPSILTIILVYFLGRDLFEKKVGLISCLMMGVYWVFFFYSFRLLTDIFSVFLGMLAFYFFWSFYIKNQKNSGLYLSIFFGVLAFSTRFALALVPITCAVYLLFIKKFSTFKDKTIWKSVGIFFLCIAPYIIYFIFTKFHLFKFYFGDKAVSMQQPIALYTIPMILGNISNFLRDGLLFRFWSIAFLIGFVILIPKIFLGFDLFWKQKDKSLNSTFFVFLWILIHLFFYIVIFRAANDRWLLMLMPAIFFIAAQGILFLYNSIKKYSKEVAIVIAIILLLGGAYQNLKYGIDLTELKKSSYEEVKLGALWLKENTSPDAKVVTSSIVQNQYYSERQSIPFSTNESIWGSCSDLYGKLDINESCQKMTEESFNRNVEKEKPDYLIVSIFEPVFTPQWAYNYPERYNLVPVTAFPQNNPQPNLVIYQFKK